MGPHAGAREIARPFERRRHQRRLRRGVAVARPLVVHHQDGTVPEHVRDAYGTAERQQGR